MELQAYYKLLEEHNWKYQDEENNIARWRAGHEGFKEIIRLSTSSPQHRKLFIAYKGYMAGVTTSKPQLRNYL